MKKLIAVLLVAFSVSASAANTSDVIGGVIGGIVIGKILTDNERQQRAPVPPPPVYVPAPQYPLCPHPYLPVYDNVWIIDQYNRNIQVQRFIGCR